MEERTRRSSSPVPSFQALSTSRARSFAVSVRKSLSRRPVLIIASTSAVRTWAALAGGPLAAPARFPKPPAVPRAHPPPGAWRRQDGGDERTSPCDGVFEAQGIKGGDLQDSADMRHALQPLELVGAGDGVLATSADTAE